jgi:Tfp pilus assembly protein PilO
MGISISKRETILIMIFIFTGSVMGYFHLRYRPESVRLAQEKKDNLKLQNKLDSFKLEKEPQVSSQSLQKELDQIEGILKRVEEKVIDFEKQFALLDAPESIQSLQVEISTLARLYHVLITENIPYEGESANFREISLQLHSLDMLPDVTNQKYFGRPLRKMTIRGRYRDFLRFIEGLNMLSARVVVMQLQMDAIHQPHAVDHPAIIEARIVVLL